MAKLTEEQKKERALKREAAKKEQAAEEAKIRKPKVAVLLDYAEFNMMLAKKLHGFARPVRPGHARGNPGYGVCLSGGTAAANATKNLSWAEIQPSTHGCDARNSGASVCNNSSSSRFSSIRLKTPRPIRLVTSSTARSRRYGLPELAFGPKARRTKRGMA